MGMAAPYKGCLLVKCGRLNILKKIGRIRQVIVCMYKQCTDRIRTELVIPKKKKAANRPPISSLFPGVCCKKKTLVAVFPITRWAMQFTTVELTWLIFFRNIPNYQVCKPFPQAIKAADSFPVKLRHKSPPRSCLVCSNAIIYVAWQLPESCHC